MLTVGDAFRNLKLQAVVGMERGKEFEEIMGRSDPGKWTAQEILRGMCRNKPWHL